VLEKNVAVSIDFSIFGYIVERTFLFQITNQFTSLIIAYEGAHEIHLSNPFHISFSNDPQV
jgi:hypothetical protein